eukprot:gene8028-12493_t
MSDIKVKIFIGNDIRRLTLPTKTHYDDLVQKVYNFYLTQQPEASPETLATLRFKYLDIDGDWVSFSSNEEWKEAFSNFSEVLKIKIETPQGEKKSHWKKHHHGHKHHGEHKKEGHCPFGGAKRHCKNPFEQFMGGMGGFPFQQQNQPQQQPFGGFDFSQLGNLAQNFMNPQNMEMAKNLFQQFTGEEKTENEGVQQPFDFSKMMENFSQFLPKQEGEQKDAFDFSKLFEQFVPKDCEQKEGEKAVHYAVLCDKCDHTPIGLRFKCEDCSDFDYCGKCYSEDATNHFGGKHKFTKIDKPEKCKFFEKFVKQEEKQQQEEAPKVEEEIIMDEELYDVVDEVVEENAPSAPKVEEKVEENSPDALSLLAQMGFSNQSVNEYLLKKHNGDLQRVVYDLLNNQ